MGVRVYQYSQGAAAAEDELISFVELASNGTPGAKSRLVYPGSPPPFAPVTYFTNPDKRAGFDNDTLILPPARTVVETLDDQVVVGFAQTLRDRIVEETWTNEGGKLSMPTHFYRQLRGYDENQPDPDTVGFVQWFPANQSALGFNVQLVFLTAGGDPVMPMTAPEFRPIGGGGNVGGDTIAGPDGDLDVAFASSGWQTEEIKLRLRIVSQVV